MPHTHWPQDICPTHPLLHDFHLLLQYWQDSVLGQALLQLDDILAVFQDLRTELFKVQLLKCALETGQTWKDTVRLRKGGKTCFLLRLLQAMR